MLLPCFKTSAQKYNLLPDTVGYCEGDNRNIEIVSHFDKTASVNWVTPMGKYANTRKVKPVKEGKYYAHVTTAQLPHPLFDSVYVRVYKRPELRLRDTVLCKGSPLLLDPGHQPGWRYQWSNGQTVQKLKINHPGRYWVKVTSGACAAYDTVTVKAYESALNVTGGEVIFCLNDAVKTIGIRANPGTSIIWNTGSTTPSVSATREGIYWVKSESQLCGVHTDTIRVKLKACECEMFIPNSFTPNDDGRNDYFFAVSQCEYSYYSITINDRWGDTVFSSNNFNSKWDGRYKGNLVPEDIYTYHIESIEKNSDKRQVRNGHISLFR